MQSNTKDTDNFILFKQQSKVTAVYTTRKNGFSHNCFNSFNLGFHVGDDPYCVEKNRNKLKKILNTTDNDIFFMDQIHSNNIFVLDEQTKNILQKENITEIKKTDALITNIKNTAICSMGADCPQIALYEPKEEVIAVIHAGWKGLINNIIEKTITEMCLSFNCQKENILTASSAFICEKCFVVKEDTAAFFKEKFAKNKKIIKHSEQININLKEAIKTILLQNNISEKNINFLDMCTACNKDIFFSYRKENKKCGRNALAIKLH